MPGVFQDHVLPALQVQHKAALSCSCSGLRVLVQQRVTTLKLLAGQCCRLHDDRLALKLPAVSSVCLRPGNLHEAMFVLPIFFMQDARYMPGITSLQLLDQLPDRPPTQVQCNSCTAWTSTYDLSAILATAATCMPQLAALDFSTHYISDAECAAIALMTGLTRLQLRSTHGTKSGGIARFTSLKKLADLRLTDSNLRSDHTDVAMLLGRCCLTQLRLGRNSSHATAAAAAAAAAAARGAGSSAAPLQPPPLVELSVTLSPYMNFSRDAFKALVSLTRLTQLRIGWLVRPEHELVTESVSAVLPLQQQRELSQLLRLQRLGLGWVPSYEVLGVLGYLTDLTALQLGGLPARPPPATLKLSSLLQLTSHVRPPSRTVPNVAQHPQSDMLPALAAFPGLTRLELTGTIGAVALAQLPAVAAPCLQELLLPQRMCRVGWNDLASLQKLTGLTSLRLGWKAGLHNGPPMLPDDEDDFEVEEDWLFEPIAVLPPGVGLGVQPQQLLAASSRIRRLELLACPGVSGLQVEQALLAVRPQQGPDSLMPQQGPDSSGGASSVGPDGVKPAAAVPDSLTPRQGPDSSATSAGPDSAKPAGPDSLTPTVPDSARPAGPDSLAQPPAGRLAGPERLHSCDIVVRPGGGRSAAELGMGYQYFGTLLSPAEERGNAEVPWWGGAAEAVEEEDGAVPEMQQQQLQEPGMQLQLQAQAMQQQMQQLLQQMQQGQQAYQEQMQQQQQAFQQQQLQQQQQQAGGAAVGEPGDADAGDGAAQEL
ncbi:hypothetical protein OEZ85_000798 [Tetradesmus obliquus]|uniref:Uncharacterized protein n=1 Tax=Tetradesmus obliquus TaxID=3088 RepID=A0ABY8UJR7_TETOB|nr:hypothetical protein OEZ85_000798 [Tetradesmus obliquus]